MSTRPQAARAYLAQLVLTYEELEAERQSLLNAQARIVEIQAEKQALLADAQEALSKYNALEGTNYTLAQARSWFQRPSAPVPPPPLELP